MHELRVTVAEILGSCPAHRFIKVGDAFTVENGNLHIPRHDQRICLWALPSIMCLLPAEECSIVGKADGTWMHRTHQVQCPDPEGRVIFRVERTEKVAHLGGREGDS